MTVSNEKWKKLRDEMSACGISESEITETFCLGSGSGGQKINKTHATVQLTYNSYQINYGKTRSREDNRYFARKELIERIQRLSGVETKKMRQIQKKIKQKKRRKKKSEEKYSRE